MERAKPGNFIVFTDKAYVDTFDEEKHLVVKCPDHHVGDEFLSSRTWVMLGGHPKWLGETARYKIIKSKNKNGESDVDKKLTDQRDANLRSIFG